jgi:hypothetical protein
MCKMDVRDPARIPAASSAADSVGDGESSSIGMPGAAPTGAAVAASGVVDGGAIRAASPPGMLTPAQLSAMPSRASLRLLSPPLPTVALPSLVMSPHHAVDAVSVSSGDSGGSETTDNPVHSKRLSVPLRPGSRLTDGDGRGGVVLSPVERDNAYYGAASDANGTTSRRASGGVTASRGAVGAAVAVAATAAVAGDGDGDGEAGPTPRPCWGVSPTAATVTAPATVTVASPNAVQSVTRAEAGATTPRASAQRGHRGSL